MYNFMCFIYFYCDKYIYVVEYLLIVIRKKVLGGDKLGFFVVFWFFWVVWVFSSDLNVIYIMDFWIVGVKWKVV